MSDLNFNDFSRDSIVFEDERKELIVKRVMRNVYWWMSLALALTGLVAYLIAHSYTVMTFIVGHPAIIITACIAELILVIALSFTIDRLSFTTAFIMFILYSVINGFTLSTIFLTYEIGSIYSTLFVCTITFVVMALIGSFTKKDLSVIGKFLMYAVVGLIIALIVEMFRGGDNIIVSIIGVIVFAGLTAYDTQKTKKILSMQSDEEFSENTNKISLMCALSLYLDFINMFLYLLRIFGKKN